MTITTNPLGRLRTLLLCLACIVLMPMLAIILLCQALAGSKVRALRMCIALDQCGNAGLGGSEDETISSRAARAARDGEPWGPLAVRIIDAVFGKGHCLSSLGI